MNADQRFEDITAADIMRVDLTTIPSAMPLSEVERVLTENNVSGAPVVDHAGRIAGVISLRDIAERHAEDPDGLRAPQAWSWGIEAPREDAPTETDLDREPRGREVGAETDLEDRLQGDREEHELERMATGENVPLEAPDTAADLMTAEVHAVDKKATLPEVAAAMVDHAIHRVLVRANGKFVGMVTSTDVLRALASRAGAKRDRATR